MTSVSLSRSILYTVSSPKPQFFPALSNCCTPKTLSSYLTERSSLKHLKIPKKPCFANLKAQKNDKSSSDDAFNFLLLRDSGFPRQKAIRYASNKNLKSRVNNLPTLHLKSKEKLGSGKRRKNFKSYKNENESVDVDKINLALKSAIEKRIEKWSKNLKNSKVCESKDKECKGRILMKRVNK